MNLSCALTGHRDLPADFDFEKLENAIVGLMEEGVKNFYCGLARGFDLYAGAYVIKHKKKYGAKLIGCIPCPAQDKFFSFGDKSRYECVLSGCDEKICLSDNYYAGCMQARDRYMVDESDTVLCYLDRRSGGTWYTVNYAVRSGRRVLNLNGKE